MRRLEADHTTAKERVSLDKMKSLWGIVAGARASHFNVFLNDAPSSNTITDLSQQLVVPVDIHNVILDVDGTIVAPYAWIDDRAIEKLKGYLKDGRKVGVYTNSPHTDRLDRLRDNGIFVAETGIPKPTLKGFEFACKQQDMDPRHTAMVGNSPITDMPLVGRGQAPLFPLNVLVKSIPPNRQDVKSWMQYYRAWFFHYISVAAAEIVQRRNPNMLLGELPVLCCEKIEEIADYKDSNSDHSKEYSK